MWADSFPYACEDVFFCRGLARSTRWTAWYVVRTQHSDHSTWNSGPRVEFLTPPTQHFSLHSSVDSTIKSDERWLECTALGASAPFMATAVKIVFLCDDNMQQTDRTALCKIAWLMTYKYVCGHIDHPRYQSHTRQTMKLKTAIFVGSPYLRHLFRPEKILLC